MASTLTATNSSQASSPTTTQDPQANVQSLSGGTQSSNVQPGTTNSLLRGDSGITLHTTQLSTVSLAPSDTKAASGSVAGHHANPVLLSVAIILCLVAVILFRFAGRSVKTTT
jgi:hypothetical protein